MKKLVIASNNSHKVAELREILGSDYQLLTLAEIGCYDDIPETADTFEGNALLKAKWVKDKYGYDAIADDSGLEVEALNGAPGVYSARYAGEPCNDSANNALLLKNLEGCDNRNAAFRSVIVLLQGDKEPQYFSGKICGKILTEPRGNGGFGYDPLFLPDGWNLTFAQAPQEAKNADSHRARAAKELAKYLKQNS